MESKEDCLWHQGDTRLKERRQSVYARRKPGHLESGGHPAIDGASQQLVRRNKFEQQLRMVYWTKLAFNNRWCYSGNDG